MAVKTGKENERDHIAIVGVGCRLPGGVRDLPGLWEFLKEQKDVHTEFKAPRFSAAGFHHANSDRPGTAVASHGFLLDEDPLLFDPAFFGITDAEVETLDAAQRKLLECTYEAFENAGDTLESVSGSRTGVFVGDICFDNYLTQTRDWDYATKYSATGSFPNMLANRLHYVFNLKGPSLLVNSACTSAMYALHLAITSMRNGDCDAAIVAGSNWVMDPGCHIAMGKLGALSATSRSHTFDASADGYARGEGFAALYLKTASRAIKDASPIRCLVTGTTVNANGRTTGITNPSGAAQEIVIREAYKHAGVDPSETTLLECHGTGTRVGDPIEVMAAGKVFGPSRSDNPDHRLIVGSVKTNMGHLEGACALPGILKVMTAIEAGAIPPTLGFKTPNPRIDFDKAKARVNTDVEHWPSNRLKRASVTSAGFGGTNGHCVIDHVHNLLPHYVKPGIVSELATANGTNGHSDGMNGSSNGTNGASHGVNGSNTVAGHHPIVKAPVKVRTSDAEIRRFVVLPFSAHNLASLASNMHTLSPMLHGHSLADVAYTLAAKRSKFIHRGFCIVDKDDLQHVDLTQSAKTFSSPQPIQIGFVFTGQGAQFDAMGAELFEYMVFRDTIRYLDSVLAMLPKPAPWKIADILSGNCEKDLVQTPACSQTACTALQIGLVDLLASWSVYSAAVVGHSSGEMAAAYAAGRITAAEAITSAYYRGQAVSLNKKKGAMLAVGLGPSAAVDHIRDAGLEGRIGIAAVNSPDSVTISGDEDGIETLSASLTKRSIFNRVLRTNGLAYHSHHMLALGDDYADTLAAAIETLKDDHANGEKYEFVSWYSSVTPSKDMNASEGGVSAAYWRSNLESPVQFSQALSNLLHSSDVGALVEIGPHPALKSPVAQIVGSLGKTLPHLASVKRKEDSRRSLLELAGTLFALNAQVDLVAVNAVDGHEKGQLIHGTTAVDLPPYQFTYGPILYHETRASKEYRLRNVPRHDLLGSRIPGTTRLRPQWRNVLRLSALPWLDDHRVPPHVLHPGAAHVVMAMLAAEDAYNDSPDALPVEGIALRNVSIKKTLVVPEDDHGIEIVLTMELEDGATAKSPGWATFSISSVVRDTDQWTEHCSGSAKVEVGAFQHALPIETTMDARAVDAEAWYKRFLEMGLQFGPSFQGYSEIRADPVKNIASARLSLNTTAGMFPGGESKYPIHPASLDLIIRLGLMACNGGQAETGAVQLPIHFDQLRFKTGSLQDRDWAAGISKGELRGLRGAYAQLQMLSEDGEVILDVDNMRFIDLANEQSASATGQASKAYSSPFNRLVWRPDAHSLNQDQWRIVLENQTGSEIAYPRLATVFDLLGHANPDIRILQVNASFNALATHAVLNTLIGANRIKRYRDFLLTDASDSVLPPEQGRDVSNGVLDMTKNPQEQGYKPVYDVVLSAGGIRENSDAQQYLHNCVNLLRPGGKLILLEPARQNWDHNLRAAGFEAGADVIVDEKGLSLVIASRRPREPEPDGRKPLVHLLHGSSGAPALLDVLAKEFERRGVSSQASSLQDVRGTLGPGSRVVAFLDQENLLLNPDQDQIAFFQHLASHAASMIWLTSSGFVKGRSQDGAFVTGLLRTLGSENPAGELLAVDIDADNFQVDSTVVDRLAECIVDQEITLYPESGDDRVNRELTWQDGCLWVSRIVPDNELQGYADLTAPPDDQDLELVGLNTLAPVRAAFKTAGLLTSLYFRPYLEILRPLPKDWIEVKVLAVGLNWKDLGLCTGRFDQNNLSNEYCGIVTKIGSDASHVQIGDRVYGMGKGHFGNYTQVPAALAHKLREGVDSSKAATMPLVYMTAVYAFEHVTRLRKGQKVLIQSASGGLGLAAIQLARSKGAEIFATAGTPDKIAFLTEKMGIPYSHIFSSRNPQDFQRMVQATQNGGFDVILSNAQGPMLYESVKALAPLGHLIDVGRMDVTSSKNIGLELFQKSASFSSFDLGLVVEHDPELGGELMRSVDAHFTAGRIGPIEPCMVSDISELGQTLLSFSKGTHIGKMVVSYETADSKIKVQKAVTPAQFDEHARYILVGGLSGLGRSLVRFMASRGARDIVVWSRSGPDNLSAEATALIEELAQDGTKVQAVSCDVSDLQQVTHAMQAATADGMHIRGVLNYAVSYQDISFDKITLDMFRKGMAAKVLGTKNLHEATKEMRLDFFTMVSSFGTVYAFPTQSVYLAANNFMDYFARYRRRLGLPASTVSLGFISDLGALTQDAVTVNLFARTKGQTVTGAQVLRMLEPALVKDMGGRSSTWLGNAGDPLSSANIITGVDPSVLAAMKREEAESSKTLSTTAAAPRWYRDARVSIMLRATDDAWRHKSGAESSSASDLDNVGDLSPTAQLRRQYQTAMRKIRDQEDPVLRATESNKAVELVTDAIRNVVAGMLFVDPTAVNPNNTVLDHGIDSLLAAEFRNWLMSSFGKSVSMLDLMDAKTSIIVLAKKVVGEEV